MLIQVYILCLVLSAVLLVASLLLGDQADAAVPQRGQRLQFWTFFVAFFGLSGLLFDGLDLLRPSQAFWSALAAGFAAALGTSRLTIRASD